MTNTNANQRADERADETRTIVRDHYAKISTSAGTPAATGCCGPSPAGLAPAAPSCCAPGAPGSSLALGYTASDLTAVPDGADLGLGCGNPTAIAALQPGEVVLDLGAGGGFDCFLAARAVGPTGRVIGVDMTPEMVSRARANARKIEAGNVEFRLGEIEHLPVADQSVDAIMSNCVINLSPEKEAVFREALRVLRPGGRLAISDVVAIAPIPEELQSLAVALAGCISGAAPLDELRALLAHVGFTDIAVTIKDGSAGIVDGWLPGASQYIASATIEARRPGAREACCAPPCCE